jgi:hypothetical protein
MEGRKKRTIAVSISQNNHEEVCLADFLHERGTKTTAMEALSYWWLPEALIDQEAESQVIQIAAIKSIHALEGRIKIIKKLAGWGREKSIEQKGQGKKIDENVEIEIREEDFE